MISTLLDRLFQRSNVPSGAKVKQRLKFILAHDRAAIEPQVFENMRHEIMRVVSKYVELDENTLDIRLESDKRMTALIANLPIRMVREELPDLVSLFDEPTEEVNTSNNSASLSLEMDQSAEDALDAIAAQETTKSTTEDISPESLAVIAERTIEVTSKIRTAANKSQNEEISDRVVIEADIPQNENVITDIAKSSELATSDVVLENSVNDQHEELEELNEQSSDQLELSLGLPDSLESQEVVVEESPKLYNQEQECKDRET
ncbi:cell division topological specificity factor MinE [Pseudanabaena galeata UHCC 0370]|uniref:Cell division topological specificity factor n=1 Tax=Pseudanabaena galeata UHCC 0370 TaxID=3110310 RepID=A0ABU5TGN2_9CYAN|nr:cell division topological specificity factor MinE [Pseudanabaena galeata]MEA5477457.1 cell division topological specificity factor MinE [Pseudanabaena galeata UHCC 0370]